MTIERPMFPPRADQSSAIVSFPKSKRPLPADRPSAIASVKSSDLRLVEGKSRGKPATHEQLSAMEFEPWAGKSEGTEALTGENWMQHRISVVFAHATMFMSKRDLINLHRDVDPDHVDQLMANIFETAEWLKAVAFMMEGAQARLIASACAAVDEGVIGDGTLPLHLADVRSTPRAMGL
ncbi:MAG: hypothetical protein QOI87_2623 [Bradyrhizobium sp.]|jgi:hypothetical protein|nr:hypothetical protein [Bradyrhizobium sp.]